MHPLTHMHRHTCTFVHTPQTHATRVHAHTHTQSHTHTLSLSLSLSHTHIQACTPTHINTHVCLHRCMQLFPVQVEYFAKAFTFLVTFLLIYCSLPVDVSVSLLQCAHAAVGAAERSLHQQPEGLKHWRLHGQPKVVVKADSAAILWVLFWSMLVTYRGFPTRMEACDIVEKYHSGLEPMIWIYEISCLLLAGW